MPDAPTLVDVNDQGPSAVAALAEIDHAIASLEALKQRHVIDASCAHCDFVVTSESGIDIHLMDVHPNPFMYQNAQSTSATGPLRSPVRRRVRWFPRLLQLPKTAVPEEAKGPR
jgi:hypothetical protein